VATVKSRTKRVSSFKPRKYEDFEVVDHDGYITGSVRIKPSGILWSPPNGKVWYGVSMTAFAAFARDKGKVQKK